MKFFSIKYKSLLAFAMYLLVITLLNAGLTSYLINRQREAEAFTQLSRQLVVFHNDMQNLREGQLAVAADAANDEKNLSDMAILYNQMLKLEEEPGATLDSALHLNQVISLNRLQLIMLSARLSSTAVYLQGNLSHYVMQDEAGIIVQRGGQPMVIGTRQKVDGKVQLAEWRNWSEIPLPAVVARQMPVVDRVTVTFDFLDTQMMALHVIVPIQGVPRESFNETIVENLMIATQETLHQSPGDEEPIVVGMFVFSRVFDTAFLEETAVNTGMSPTIFSPDGQHHAELIMLDAPAEPFPLQNDSPIQLQTANAGSASYYQAFMPWQVEEESPPLMLGLALSRENTIATIRQSITGIVIAAVLVLVIGGVIGYILIAQLVTPIESLTTAVSYVTLTNQHEHSDQPATLFAPNKLPESYLRTNDEVGQLAAAFNIMIQELRYSFDTLEQRVAERTVQLEAANKELEAFAYSVSHDLRTPLRAISGFTSILTRRHQANLNDEARHYLDNIAQAGDRMAQLIDDLLAYSRLGRAGVRRETVALDDIFRPLAEEFAGRVKEIGGTLEIADDLPTVMGNRTLLTQIFTNLLDNAFTYRRADVPVHVNVTHQTEAKTVTLCVRDNGIGIAPEHYEKIFNIFQRLHSDEDYPGTGIGLATVKKSVEILGGRLWLESDVGRGSTFFIKLPKE